VKSGQDSGRLDLPSVPPAGDVRWIAAITRHAFPLHGPDDAKATAGALPPGVVRQPYV
jgi:hypothetical protein